MKKSIKVILGILILSIFVSCSCEEENRKRGEIKLVTFSEYGGKKLSELRQDSITPLIIWMPDSCDLENYSSVLTKRSESAKLLDSLRLEIKDEWKLKSSKEVFEEAKPLSKKLPIVWQELMIEKDSTSHESEKIKGTKVVLQTYSPSMHFADMILANPELFKTQTTSFPWPIFLIFFVLFFMNNGRTKK